MSAKKIIYLGLFSLLVVSFILAGIIFSSRNQKLKIFFLDIGQGDAILMEQGSNQILIDGGPNSQEELEELGKYIPFWDRKIEVIIATHPDQDHITGLIGVMKHYKIGVEIDNEAKSSSAVYQQYLRTVQKQKIHHLRGQRGVTLKIGQTKLAILYPGKVLVNNSHDTNADSIVAKLTYGKNSFLLTGDFPTEKDSTIFQSGVDLSAKVLKVAHHGSKYATSEAFLKKVSPQEAVISVGKNNRYGHPTREILKRLKEYGVRIWRTDQDGTIEYECPNPNQLCLVVN